MRDQVVTTVRALPDTALAIPESALGDLRFRGLLTAGQWAALVGTAQPGTSAATTGALEHEHKP